MADEREQPAPAPADAPAEPPAGGADIARRRFFRHFASDLIQTAATVVGAANAIQRTSAEAASAILDPVTAGARARGVEAAGTAIRPAVFRTAFRLEGDAILLLDQRRLPEAVLEYECLTAADVAHAIRERVVRGAPAIGQVAALALALAAHRMRDARAYARRATLRGSANALLNARPSSITVRRAVDRMTARFEAIGDLSEDGEAIASALRLEADGIVAEATAAHGRIAELGVTELPDTADRPLRILTIGNSGVLAGGQFGTALGVVSAAAATGLDVEVLACETRPLLQGARLTAWELGNAGIRCTLIADSAAATRLALGDVDVVLVAADRVAANGDVAAVLGTYGLAVLAARHAVPFLVCAPLVTFDPASADGGALPIDARAGAELLRIRDTPIAPPDARAVNPVADVTPAELITAFVTEVGVLRPPFAPALAAAFEVSTAGIAIAAAAAGTARRATAPAAAPAAAPADAPAPPPAGGS